MKVLLHHLEPFALAPGGMQSQIVHTREALRQLGVEADFLRWYEGNQPGDVLHFFGRIPLPLLELARENGMSVVISDTLAELGSYSETRLKLRRWLMPMIARILPGSVKPYFDWAGFRRADACVALTPREANLISYLFLVPPEKVRVVPHGVEEVFFKSEPADRGPWLLYVGDIAPSKRVLELAEAAVQAKTPVWFIGEFPLEPGPYEQKFMSSVRQNSPMLRYEGPLTDRTKLAQIYREARGFVRLSAVESLSHSVLEAAACGCSLLLSDLPWARSVFGHNAVYCPIASAQSTAPILKSFYEAAPKLKPPPRPQSWSDTARQLKSLYESLLKP
jgi:glycosyltransferase involved in cell wall biosynthesis